MILITGATGHIGNVLARLLLEKGEEVRVLVRTMTENGSLADIPVNKVLGDVLDYNSLVKAFSGAETVYHLAGVIAISKKDEPFAHKVNYEGTVNVIKACKQAGVKKLIYTGSIHVFYDLYSNVTITEKSPILPDKLDEAYDKSKAMATLEVLHAPEKHGLNTTVVYPTGVIGPHDFKPSKFGQFLIDFINGKITIRPEGSFNFVDVRDIAKGIMLAKEKGRSGQGYLLAGDDITVTDIMKVASLETGTKIPRIKCPTWLAKFVSYLTPIYYFFSKAEPIITRYSIETLSQKFCIDCSKAKDELGYSPRPIRESIKDSIRWFKQKGMIESQKR